MLEKIYINEPNHTDLNMYRCGMEDCSPGHSWGPGVRDHFLIHYVLKGKGIFHTNSKTYHLEKGCCFLITPDTITSYQADFEEPWSYAWVGFHGLKAESYLKRANLSSDNPILRYEEDEFIANCFAKMVSTKDLAKSREIQMLGHLYILLGYMIEEAESTEEADKNKKEMYVRQAIEFIEMSYSRKISISEMARHIGLDRSYLYSLFKEYLNTSPQEFLINFRMNKACDLLKSKALSIGDVSRSVGYEDPLLFSKIFKKVKGESPIKFRKTKIENPG